ncbi:MAG TPA: rhomboid family intramembrane serine protease [Acidobacteriaceae bacterium]
MRSNGPILLALPAFRGLTRKLILFALVVFVALFISSFILPGFPLTMAELFSLHPLRAFPLIWQFATWPFIPDSLLGLLFALLSLWYFGSSLEDERGTRWFGELFFFSVVGGALLATILSLILGPFAPVLSPIRATSNGLWPIVIALLLVYARLHPDESLSFNFIFRARAKYIAAGFLLVYLIFDVLYHNDFDALNAVCTALFALFFVQIAPRKGLRHAFAERWFGIRNAYYRSKRRRAAKKFTVYMRKQGKDVSIDESGRYLGLDDKDPTDKRHMN